MSQIQDLDQTELERSLPGRLRRSADAVTPAPDALTAVRARAAGRRRRGRITMMATSAAAVAVVAAGVVVATGDEPSTGVTAGPADGGSPTTLTPPVPAEQPDATLVIYRYPNATPEMIAQDPKMGGEWAILLTADRRYHANGPLEELGADSPSEPSGVVPMLESLDSLRGQDAAFVIAALDAGPTSGVPVPTVAPDQSGADQTAALLIGLLSSGATDSTRAAEIRRLADSLAPGMTVEDGAERVTVTNSAGFWVTYDPATGIPLRSGQQGFGATDTEYLSVTRVRAADVLVPGRGTPNVPSTTTTTVVPG